MEFHLARLFPIALEELITLGVANLRPFSTSQFIYRDFWQIATHSQIKACRTADLRAKITKGDFC